MRLDKYLSDSGILSRREAAKAVRAGSVSVDGMTEKDPGRQIDPEKAAVSCKGSPVTYRRFVYVMMNKPEGLVSSTEDPREKTVLSLLDEKYRRLSLFPVGRLDKDTLGLLILTNDGELAHRLLSPKHHAEKIYRFTLAEPIRPEDGAKIAAGMTLENGEITRPAVLSLESPVRGSITLTEGKYHEIKRLFGAVGNRVTSLERTAFAGLSLDRSLERGGFRELTEEEIETLRAAGK